MPNRPPKLEGYSWICPTLTVKDVEKAVSFYEKAFGFKRGEVLPGPDGKPMHGEVSYKDIKIMMAPESMPGSPCKSPATSGTVSPTGLYVYIEDVDALYKRATEAGAKSVMKPEEQFWGDRMCLLADPDGYQWMFATNVADFDPSKIPTEMKK